MRIVVVGNRHELMPRMCIKPQAGTVVRKAIAGQEKALVIVVIGLCGVFVYAIGNKVSRERAYTNDPLPASESSPLPARDQRRAWSLMAEELNKWKSVRTVTASVETRSGFVDANEGFVHHQGNKARVALEIIPVQEKRGPTQAKIRIRLENEEGVVILKEDAYDEDTPPVAWRIDGNRPSRSDLGRVREFYDAMNLEEMFLVMLACSHERNDGRRRQPVGGRPSVPAGDVETDRVALVRKTAPQEEREFFHGVPQYLFRGATNLERFWVDTMSGELTMYGRKEIIGGPLSAVPEEDQWHLVQFGEYVYSDEGKESHFPSRFAREFTAFVGRPKRAVRVRSEVELSNVRVNGKALFSEFTVPSNALPLKESE